MFGGTSVRPTGPGKRSWGFGGGSNRAAAATDVLISDDEKMKDKDLPGDDDGLLSRRTALGISI
jgi:hypothetical protein